MASNPKANPMMGPKNTMSVTKEKPAGEPLKMEEKLALGLFLMNDAP